MVDYTYTRDAKIEVLVRRLDIKGDFSDCPACLYLIDSNPSTILKFCQRCKHLYFEKECECKDEKELSFYFHLIVIYEPQQCAYCLSKNVDYLKDKDNDGRDNVFIVEEPGWGFYTIICLECGRHSREWYKIEFENTEGY